VGYLHVQAGTYNWEDHPLPEEVKKKLSGDTKSEADGGGKSWVSLMSLGDESEFWSLGFLWWAWRTLWDFK
jgi:hypothetical protein